MGNKLLKSMESLQWTQWVDTDKAFEGEPMQIRSRMCAREFKSDDRLDLYAGTLPLEALKAVISIAANHKKTFSIMHIEVSRAYFHAKAHQIDRGNLIVMFTNVISLTRRST